MSATFVATLAAGELEVTLLAKGPPRWTARIGDSEISVDARQLPSGTWSVLFGNRSLLVDIKHGPEGRVSALVDGVVVDLTLEDARTRRFAKMINHAGGGAAKGETLRAPIAGKVVKVAVEEGADVAPGDPIVVLEAMKMENELCASRGGVVKSIKVAAGDPVETGQALVVID